MRDLSLGPQTETLLRRYMKLDQDQRHVDHKGIEFAMLAGDMAKMFIKWLDTSWCYVDACPGSVCGGPHVRVAYDGAGEVIEPADRIGETFDGREYERISRNPNDFLAKSRTGYIELESRSGTVARDGLGMGAGLPGGDQGRPGEADAGRAYGGSSAVPPARVRRPDGRQSTPACSCECNSGGFCGGCGHLGCGNRR